MATITKPVFPTDRIPEDPAAAKILGLYPQVQDGLWLQRVKVLGGIVSSGQWRALADIARRFTPGTPLHLTTRQDVEIHDLTADRVPQVQQQMMAVDLTGLGACGDTARNVTVCPCSGVVRGAPDLAPLAWHIRRMLEAEEMCWSLPRKFKISLSACAEACGQPYINDLGLVAARRGDAWGFRVIAAGSLGPRPATGVECADWVDAQDVLPLVLGAVRVFALHGDRTNRAKARLRHVRERIGNEAFVSLLNNAFRQAKDERSWPRVTVAESPAAYDASVELSFDAGNVTAEAAEALSWLAARPGVLVRVSNHHRIVVFGADSEWLAAQLACFPALSKAAAPQPAIVACPGKRWCRHGLTDTLNMAKCVREQLAGVIPPEAMICISGCPNNCAQSSVADIGLIGVLAADGPVHREAYNLLAGGGMGHDERLASLVARRLRPDEVINQIVAQCAALASGASRPLEPAGMGALSP
jgi:sulfite reductase (ferredoxin)